MSPILSINNLCKTYENGFVALDDVSLDVQRGDIFGLLGPNGAGKSTLIGILCSLINKSSGSVLINNFDIDTAFSQAKKSIGVVPQEFNFSPFEKVRDIVVTQAGYYGLTKSLANERADTYLKQLGLWEKRNEKSRELSGGMKRRLMIARALVHEPPLLILDEPTAGVDIELRRSMWDFVKKINAAGTTIILTTHYLEEAENLCNNIAIINQGNIITQQSKRALLSGMQFETFVLELMAPLPPSFDCGNFPVRRLDESTLEVDIKANSSSLNQLFAILQAQDVVVCSMRNKTNRLEALFVELLEKDRSSGKRS